VDPFVFPAHDDFRDRASDLAAMDDWWQGGDRNALALFGRRRVGMSWLFREFAHGKPAIILVSDRRARGAQLSRFAATLAPHFGGVQPSITDLPELFTALYTLAQERKSLVVIDEFPYLLPTLRREQDAVLTGVQAVMEERDSSRLKLVLCGSHIGQMATLLSESSPVRGRLTSLPIAPLRFKDAQAFIPAAAPHEKVERFAVAGGMSLYLDELGGGSLRERVCSRVLNSRGPLFNDPREVLEEELRSPGIYFSVLEELATGERSSGALAMAIGVKTPDLSQYLKLLGDMSLVERIEPVAGRAELRFRIADPFLRFWFRFVFPFQADLKSGVRPTSHYANEIEPVLAEHVAPVFESLCREWTRQELGVSRVGSWWGNALNALRKTGERRTEEIDVVGMRRSAVTVLGECKWTSGRVTARVLDDVESYKLPALRQAGVKIAAQPLIVLFSRSGFKANLVELAAERSDLRLVELDTVVGDLLRQ
jgi:AAA+ ATPase superfamily predicted ATPase